MLPELKQNPQIVILGEDSLELEFDSEGNLLSPFALEAVAH